MSENPSSKKDLKALAEELRPMIIGLGAGVGLIVVLILLGLVVGLWSGVVLPGYEFGQPH